MVWVSTPGRVFDLPVADQGVSKSHTSAAPHFKRHIESIPELEARQVGREGIWARRNGVEAGICPGTAEKVQSEAGPASSPTSHAPMRGGSTTVRPPVHEVRRHRRKQSDTFNYVVSSHVENDKQALQQPRPTVTRKPQSPKIWSSMPSALLGRLHKPAAKEERDTISESMPQPRRR